MQSKSALPDWNFKKIESLAVLLAVTYANDLLNEYAKLYYKENKFCQESKEIKEKICSLIRKEISGLLLLCDQAKVFSLILPYENYTSKHAEAVSMLIERNRSTDEIAKDILKIIKDGKLKNFGDQLEQSYDNLHLIYLNSRDFFKLLESKGHKFDWLRYRGRGAPVKESDETKLRRASMKKYQKKKLTPQLFYSLKRKPRWTLEESVAYSYGFDVHKEDNFISEFVASDERMKALLSTIYEAIEIGDFKLINKLDTQCVKPEIFLKWLECTCVGLPVFELNNYEPNQLRSFNSLKTNYSTPKIHWAVKAMEHFKVSDHNQPSTQAIKNWIIEECGKSTKNKVTETMAQKIAEIIKL